MLNSVKYTSVYKSLRLNSKLMHAYLFFSADDRLNNEIAINFAKSILCEKSSACGECYACKQFSSKSHPDLYILEQDSIKVDDINKLMSKLTTKPITAEKKLFLILNADKMNDIAQNKLLKSLEEPNPSNIFILTTTKTDKILPTILSRLTKNYVTKLSIEDKTIIANELKEQEIDISKYFKLDSLSEMINFATNKEYKNTIDIIKNLFTELNTSADIPRVSSMTTGINKNIFLPLMQELFLDCLREQENRKFNADIIYPIAVKFSNQAILKCLPLIEQAYKQQMSNVNLSYILDNLLFNILKERFLCK